MNLFGELIFHADMPNLFSLDRRRVIATLNISKNITFQRSFFGLLSVYQEYYPEKQAIQQLLRYCALPARLCETPAYAPPFTISLPEIQRWPVLRRSQAEMAIG